MSNLQFVALLDSLDLGANDLHESLRLLTTLASTVQSVDTAKYHAVIRKLLGHARADIRSLTLRLVSELWPIDKPDAHSLVLHFTGDMDPNVRTTALEILCEQNRAEYSFALQFLDDESDRVRAAAMTLFYQRTRVLCDDDYCFEQIAPQCTSNSRAVVSQALKILSLLRPSANVFADACGLSDNSKSPCFGVLQRHLEADSSQVRLEALQCIETLALALVQTGSDQADDIIYQLAKLLLDAVNDEFLEVRIAVLKLLTSIAPYFTLKKKPDLESCLFNLADTDHRMRGVLYEFFAQVQIESGSHMSLLLEALTTALGKFPEDKEDVLQLCAALGRHHPAHARHILDKQMMKDKRFLGSEYDWNDSSYVSRMVFLFNSLSRTAELPTIFRKHLAYLSDMYPDYFPLQEVESENRGSEDDAQFSLRYRSFCETLRSITTAPFPFVLKAERVAEFLLKESCSLQFAYTVTHTQKLVPAVVSPLVQGRVIAHMLMLMESAASSITGKPFKAEQFEQRLENLWRAGSAAEHSDTVALCVDLKAESTAITASRKARVSAYLRLKELVESVIIKSEVQAEVHRRSGSITFPAGEVSMSRCSLLTVRGTGDAGLHCVAELPDGGLEFAKAAVHSNGWVAHLRLPYYTGQTYVQISLAALVDSSDVLKGFGLYHPTLRCVHPFIPISSPHQVLISPKPS